MNFVRTLPWVPWVLFGALASAQDIREIPDGYSEGRADVPYGTYNTPVSDKARPYQDWLTGIEKKVFGLGRLAQKQGEKADPARDAQLTYLLERDILRFHQVVADAPADRVDAFERDALLTASVHLYRNLRAHAEGNFEDMIRVLDHALPGPNGGQFRLPGRKGEEPLYASNFRKDTITPRSEWPRLYQEKLKEFQAKGGSLDEIFTLNKGFKKKMLPYTWLEYVVLEDGEVRVTEGKAGHIILAKGQPVKAAGQMVFVKDKMGRITWAVFSNASGSYKPDLASVEKVAAKIAKQFDIPPSRVVVTKGEPFSTQTASLYHKAAGRKKDEIEKLMSECQKSDCSMGSKPQPDSPH